MITEEIKEEFREHVREYMDEVGETALGAKELLDLAFDWAKDHDELGDNPNFHTPPDRDDIAQWALGLAGAWKNRPREAPREEPREAARAPTRPRAVQQALDQINRHRASIGQASLDATDWTDDDILAEATRISDSVKRRLMR